MSPAGHYPLPNSERISKSIQSIFNAINQIFSVYNINIEYAQVTFNDYSFRNRNQIILCTYTKSV